MKTWLFVFVALVGCGTTTEGGDNAAAGAGAVRVCTKIGCSSGIAVEVHHSLQQTFAVSVKTGTQVLQTYRCETAQTCRFFVENQTPPEVTIFIDAPGGQVSRTFRPDYRVNQPNGPGCPPECRQATVRVDLS